MDLKLNSHYQIGSSSSDTQIKNGSDVETIVLEYQFSVDQIHKIKRQMKIHKCTIIVSEQLGNEIEQFPETT